MKCRARSWLQDSATGPPLPTGVSAGLRAFSWVLGGCSSCEAAPDGFGGSWHSQSGTAPARTSRSPSAAQDGPMEVEGAQQKVLEHATSTGSWKGDGQEQEFSCRTHRARAALRQEQLSPPSSCPWLPQSSELKADV